MLFSLLFWPPGLVYCVKKRHALERARTVPPQKHMAARDRRGFKVVPTVDGDVSTSQIYDSERDVPLRALAPIGRKPVAASHQSPASIVNSTTIEQQETMLYTPPTTADKPPPPLFVSSGLGRPARKPIVNWVDAAATLLSVLCLIASVVVISPSFAYAAELAYTRQIIAVGFLLGVMSQCMLRTVPFAFLLIEAQYGRSTLQNLDGLLRWTPLANNLGAIWRTCIVILLLLPLGLSVGYKRYTGGIGDTHATMKTVGLGPTAPPGTQGIGFTSTMTNATLPFVGATIDNETVPSFGAARGGGGGGGQVYGYNLVLFSTTDAAALDAPLPENVSSIQHSLGPGEAATISADVRGTASHYHTLGDSDRSNASWADAWTYGAWKTITLYNGYKFGFLAVSTASGDGPGWYNSSWVYMGAYPTDNDDDDDRVTFQRTASLCTVSRKSCHATWTVTSSSILLASATCDSDLWSGYQYLTSSQLGVADSMPPLMAEYLAPFATTRNASDWRVPSFALAAASMYQSRVASSSGSVPVQLAGSLYQDWLLNDTTSGTSFGTINDTGTPLNLSTGAYTERYNGTLTRVLNRPVLRADWSLYALLAIQPSLTALAFVAVCALHETPISRGFGLISVLAGVERGGLDVLAGATFSGETKRSVTMEIRVVEDDDDEEEDEDEDGDGDGEEHNIGPASPTTTAMATKTKPKTKAKVCSTTNPTTRRRKLQYLIGCGGTTRRPGLTSTTRSRHQRVDRKMKYY